MVPRISFAFITILVLTGCAAAKPKPTAIAPSPIAIAPVTPAPTPTPTPIPDRYWDGIEKGAGAAAFAQSAQNASDWELVGSRFQSAIGILRSVPQNSPHFKDAQNFIKRFSGNASDAKLMATGKLSAAPASLLDNRLPIRPEEPKPIKAAVTAAPFVQPVPTPATSVSPRPTAEPESVRRRRYYVPKTRPIKRPKRLR